MDPQILAPWLDAIFAAMFVIGVPVLGFFAHRSLQAAIAEGYFSYRRDTYRHLMFVQGATSATLISTWLWLERTPEALGFVTPSAMSAAISAGVVALVLAVLLWMRRRLRASEELRTEAWEQLRGFMDLLPQNQRELRMSYGLACVVGFTEELAYRGFLLWWLQNWLDFWPAALLSSIGFGFAHLYQGPKGILKTTGAGFVFACTYYYSGSLILPMVLHAIIDAHAFRVAMLLRNRFEWADRPYEPPSTEWDDDSPDDLQSP